MLTRQAGVALLTLGVLLLSGCIGSGVPLPQNAMAPVTEYGHKQEALLELILVPAWIIFIAVELVLVYTIWRFRARPGQPRPPQIHGNTRLEVAWTIAPALVLAFIAVPTVTTIFDIGGPPPANAMRVEVIGHQWWWEFRYPDLDLVTANEVHMPVGQYVSFELKSDDVIHSFAFPRLGGKRDVVPGHTNNLWLDSPKEPGPAEGYYGQCAEYCGTSHANMRMRAFVDSQSDFDAWVRNQRGAAAAATDGPAARGAELFQSRGCTGCHTVVGVNATAETKSEDLLNSHTNRIGPNLTHIGSRKTLAGGIVDNTPAEMERWLLDPPAVKPGSKMPKLGLSQDDAAALVAYLETLK